VSLSYAAQGAEHRQIEVDGSLLSILLGAGTTAGQVSVIRARAPAGFATTVHVHSQEDEMYVLLEGGGIFWAGQDRYQLSPGGVAVLPRDVPHALRITAPSDLLAICTPAGIERFFEAIGRDPSQPQPEGWAASPEIMTAAVEDSGQRLLGPPLAEHDLMPAAYLHPKT
jgi:mannose-6-phosphate isomerase-like protein (cupin superfamily)